MIAQALTGANRSDEAAGHLQVALADPSTEGMAAGMLGYWHQACGHFSEARTLFERSMRAEPHQSAAYYGWVQGGAVSEADAPVLDQIRSLVEGAELPAADRMILEYALGKAEADLQQFERSIACFDRANALAFEVNLGGKRFNRRRYAEIIDGTIATFGRETLQRSRGIGSNSKLPIFVVGMMRSGTTLVEQILSSHPEVGGAGEVNFWLDEAPGMFNSSKRTFEGRKLRNHAERYAEVLKELAPGSAIVVDKMPQNFQVLGVLHLAYPRAPIVHIRRNPADNCLSIWMTAYERSPEFAHVRSDIVFAYRQYERLMAHWRKVIAKDRLLEIDYEDLTAEPERVTRRLVSFCGLPWDDACLRPQDNLRVVATPSLTQVRKPVNRSAVGRWKSFEPWLGEFAELIPSG